MNNDAYSLEEVMGIFDELEWIRDNSYSNIKLFIATEESMLKLKQKIFMQDQDFHRDMEIFL